MRMKDIRTEFNRRIKHTTMDGNYILADYYREAKGIVEQLYNDLLVADFSRDILREFNGYQTSTGNYETFHLKQTYNLRSLEIDDRDTARDFAEWFLIN